MKIHYGEQADALHVRLDEVEIVESEEVRPGIVLDLDRDDRVVGVEILKLRERFTSSSVRPIQVELA